MAIDNHPPKSSQRRLPEFAADLFENLYGEQPFVVGRGFAIVGFVVVTTRKGGYRIESILYIAAALRQRLALTAAKMISRLVLSDDIEPTAERIARLAAAELFDLPRHGAENFLGYIGCLAPLHSHPTAPAIDQRAIDRHERAPGVW